MIKRVTEILSWFGVKGVVGGARPEAFHLVRYFTVTSLVALAVVGSALYLIERSEEAFFADVQREQGEYFAQVQADMGRQQEKTAQNDLLKAHEAAHVNLTRVFANTLWRSDFAPFLDKVQRFTAERCRAIEATQEARAAGVRSDRRRACFDELGRRIRSLPEFGVLDAKVHAIMRNSTVFKIKVFDLRGITVYSSEHAQVGEDKANNLGWKMAASGQPASELTHRDRFSAFEGVVENRDLISSYVPRRTPDGKAIVGVFEIYSDITPFLEQIKRTANSLRGTSAVHQATISAAAIRNKEKVHASSDRFLATMAALIMALYAALFLIARNGQRIINEQARAQERSVQHEQEWHQEKMAALATMAATIAHEVGNPLATISALAEKIAAKEAEGACSDCRAASILEQTDRIATMTRQIADFAAARREGPESVDVNQMIKAVCDFLGNDDRYRHSRIECRAAEHLPACTLVPDFLNESLMNLLQACAHGKPDKILVETAMRGSDVLIRITCEPESSIANLALSNCALDTRLESARRRVANLRGTLVNSGAALEITLPCNAPAESTRS